MRFFFKLYTVSRNGRLNCWECDTPLSGLIKLNDDDNKPSAGEEIGDDTEMFTSNYQDEEDEKQNGKNNKNSNEIEQIDEENTKIRYLKSAK